MDRETIDDLFWISRQVEEAGVIGQLAGTRPCYGRDDEETYCVLIEKYNRVYEEYLVNG